MTVFRDDEEAADIWLKQIGVDPARFGRLGEQSNFWAMGDTGPCGPCTEIFYDHGPGVAGGPPGSPDEEGDRYVEIWNLVFMQYDRAADGALTPLPKPSVDTGMGLERIAAVVQGVHSNYDIDLFRALIAAAAEATATRDLSGSSLRVIADHIRAAAFLITDGVLPGNEGRGYVLRRIIRRALRHGYELGQESPFFHALAQPLADQMGAAYPELTEAVPHIERVLRKEEERFALTLSQGMRILKEALAAVPRGGQLAGDLVFKLYDTYGFPVDLTGDVARAHGITLDEAGYEAAMEVQRERSRESGGFEAGPGETLRIDEPTVFTGYDALSGTGCVRALTREDQVVEKLEAGQRGGVVLDRSPFYAESGGQVGDQGWLTAGDLRFRVEDTQKAGDACLHLGMLEQGSLAPGATLEAQVDAALRGATVLNHSATHLLHAALREVLGAHVTQKGSLVAPDRLRFDFSHYEAVTPAQLRAIEDLVNDQIRANAEACTRLMSYDEAVKAGAMALFGEKYGDEVRVLQIGEFSTELCGGTHVHRAGDIGLFRITAESGIAAGIRRIEAVTGARALERVRESEASLERIGALLKSSRADAEVKVGSLVERSRALERELQQLKARLAAGGTGRDPAAQAREIKGIKVLADRLNDDLDARTIRDLVDQLKAKLGSGIVVLGSATADGKVRLAAGVTQDVTGRIKAGELVVKMRVHGTSSS